MNVLADLQGLEKGQMLIGTTAPDCHNLDQISAASNASSMSQAGEPSHSVADVLKMDAPGGMG